MSGARHKRKGDRLERQIVTTLKEHGLEARRVPLSGSVQGFEGDVQVCVNGHALTLECKARADSFKRLYGWLEARDALVVKADRKPPLVVMEIEALLGLLETTRGDKACPSDPRQF